MNKKHNDTYTDRLEIYTEEINKKNKKFYYKTPDSYKHEFIKLNMIEKAKSQFRKLKDRKNKISMTCYTCDKSDYIARNCQLKNKV